MKKVIKCLTIIIGTLIGAGFASGQEILSFFNRYSMEGVWGIIFSSLLFGIIIFLIIQLSNRNMDYKQFIENSRTGILVIKSFTLICFCTMLSAMGTYINTQYNVPYFIGIVIVDVICFLSLLYQFKGLEKINNWLVPIILLGILIVSLHSKGNMIIGKNESTMHILTSNWCHSGLLYVGYNSILLIPILMELNVYKMSKREVSALSVLAILFFCITGLLVFFTINKYYPNISSIEMPMVYISKQLNGFAELYYGIVVLLATYTTAFSCGYSFLKLGTEKNYFKNCVWLLALGIAMSVISFSSYINYFFPIFGYIGIFQILYAFYKMRKLKK